MITMALAALALATPAATDLPTTPAGKQALDILEHAVAFPTVKGRGQVPAYADYLKQRLVAGGFAADDVAFTPVGETGYLTARWHGSDPSTKPLVILGHMDVVEAKPSDWQRDPFTPVIENGYIFGRGSLDDKGQQRIVPLQT